MKAGTTCNPPEIFFLLFTFEFEMRAGRDYYITDDGLLVFTAVYLSDRGYCCGNGCLNCPYDYMKVPEPKRSQLLEKRGSDEGREKE